jgi:spermidine synthase
LLLPWLGSMASLRLLSMVALLLGIGALLAEFVKQRSITYSWKLSGAALFAVASLSVLTIPKTFDIPALTGGSNVYFTPSMWGENIEHLESVHGGLTSVARASDGVYSLLTNGKFQGNNSDGGEMVAQVGIAVAPLLHTTARDEALVIGYGTGVTTRTLWKAGFTSVDVAEISKDIVTLANKYFANVNGEVMSKPGVHLRVADGRNFLLTQPKTYDLISMEISSIWFAGAANLYNREFYQLAHSRLREHGVLQQWIQLHHITAYDIAVVLASVRSEFKYVWLYVVGGQGIIVASNSEQSTPNDAKIQRVRNSPETEAFLTRYNNDPSRVASMRVLSPSEIDNVVATMVKSGRYRESTDNNLYLEYSTPKGNAQGIKNFFDINIAALREMARTGNTK